jgi:hypothetical protein
MNSSSQTYKTHKERIVISYPESFAAGIRDQGQNSGIPIPWRTGTTRFCHRISYPGKRSLN